MNKKIPRLTKEKLKELGLNRVRKAFRQKLRNGAKVELEHWQTGDNWKKPVMIALQHLQENPNYYRILKKSGL